MNWILPTCHILQFKQASAGVKRSKLELPYRKAPLLPVHLRKIYHHVACVPLEIQKVFWVACVAAFFPLLRRSNFFFSSPADLSFLRVEDVTTNEAHHLACEGDWNVSFQRSGINIPLAAIPRDLSCPAKCRERISKTPEVSKLSPLFSFLQGKKLFPLDAVSFSKYLRQILRKRGYDDTQFSIHSLRKGAATFADACGIAPDELKA